MSPKKKVKTEDTQFVWEDAKVQLLLEITKDFKAKKMCIEVG